MESVLTKEKFVELMYRNFGDDIDNETWEDIFDEMATEFKTIEVAI